MRSLTVSLAAVVILAACQPKDPYKVQNPDPNHTHADFAIWVDGEQIDFTGNEYMSGVSYDDASHDEEHEYYHEHLHLHDNVGHVLHRHKPGLSVQEFLESLNVLDVFGQGHTWRMFINGEEEEFALDYIFKDLDKILLTTSAGSAEVLDQLEKLTDDACLYSKRCPWRGGPPAENCIADPAIPCVAPLEDY
jgi:hypothetical protein